MKQNQFFIVAVVVVVLSTTIFVNFYLKNLRQIPSRTSKYEKNTSLQTDTPVPTQNLKATTKPSLPNFSNNPIQDRIIFDMSTWTTYEQKEIGLTFKYPKEWKIKTDSYTSTNPLKGVCNNSVSCNEFELVFDSGFEVYGKSPNYYPGMQEIDEYGFWANPTDDFCKKKLYGYVLHCQTVNNVTDITRISLPVIFYDYARFHLVKLSNKNLSGLTFGGTIGAYDLLEKYDKGEYDSRIITLFNKALLERKLPKEIMYNFDLYEKIFETISVN